MRTVRFWTITAGLSLSIVAALFFLSPTTHGQVVVARGDDGGQLMRRVEVLGGRGASIGVTIRDVEEKDVTANRLGGRQGAVVEDVEDSSPAAKAGFKAGDVVVNFDGENVRSARQFARLVEETPAGREVKTTVMRQASRLDLQVTPGAGEGTRLGMVSPRERGNYEFRLPAMPDMRQLERLPDTLGPMMGGAQLGISAQDLNDELAEYFGAKEGVLVASVRPDSPAAKAGFKVGDVITTVNGASVGTVSELRRRLNEGDSEEVTLGIVRDKKSQTLKATIERPGTQMKRQRWPV